jgi:hypothetical protein
LEASNCKERFPRVDFEVLGKGAVIRIRRELYEKTMALGSIGEI